MKLATARRPRAVIALLATAVLGAVTGTAAVTGAPASAAPRWAPASSAQITPGVQMYTKGGQCTGNFVFTDASARVYVGYAAHCAGTGAATDTDGCRAASLPLRTRVTFHRGGTPVSTGTRVGRGRLVYSSWRAMSRAGTRNANACAYNDFALVKVDRADVRKVNPSVPFWGGPVGIDRDGTRAGEKVYSYGSSSLRFGLGLLSPKSGVSIGDARADRGWSHPVYTATPGIPGDSGSAFLDVDGEAVGTLSTLVLAPLPAANNLGDLAKQLAFARRHSGIKGLRLVKGTEPFSPVP